MPIDARSWRLAGLGALLAILFLLFGFGSTAASANLVISPWDKVLHLGVFALLALALRAALPSCPWPAIFLLALAIAVVDELHQLLVPGRHPGWDDGLADAAGAALGLLAWRWLEGIVPPGAPCRN